MPRTALRSELSSAQATTRGGRAGRGSVWLLQHRGSVESRFAVKAGPFDAETLIVFVNFAFRRFSSTSTVAVSPMLGGRKSVATVGQWSVRRAKGPLATRIFGNNSWAALMPKLVVFFLSNSKDYCLSTFLIATEHFASYFFESRWSTPRIFFTTLGFPLRTTLAFFDLLFVVTTGFVDPGTSTVVTGTTVTGGNTTVAGAELAGTKMGATVTGARVVGTTVGAGNRVVVAWSGGTASVALGIKVIGVGISTTVILGIKVIGVGISTTVILGIRVATGGSVTSGIFVGPAEASRSPTTTASAQTAMPPQRSLTLGGRKDGEFFMHPS